MGTEAGGPGQAVKVLACHAAQPGTREPVKDFMSRRTRFGWQKGSLRQLGKGGGKSKLREAEHRRRGAPGPNSDQSELGKCGKRDGPDGHI